MCTVCGEWGGGEGEGGEGGCGIIVHILARIIQTRVENFNP